MFILVGIGGFFGSALRYGLSLSTQHISMDWPLGTLAANFIACLAMGVIAGLAARYQVFSPEVRILIGTGFCGGLSTMSSMIFETSEMIRVSEYLNAVIYSAGTFFLSMAAFLTGIFGFRLLARFGERLWN